MWAEGPHSDRTQGKRETFPGHKRVTNGAPDKQGYAPKRFTVHEAVISLAQGPDARPPYRAAGALLSLRSVFWPVTRTPTWYPLFETGLSYITYAFHPGQGPVQAAVTALPVVGDSQDRRRLGEACVPRPTRCSPTTVVDETSANLFLSASTTIWGRFPLEFLGRSPHVIRDRLSRRAMDESRSLRVCVSSRSRFAHAAAAGPTMGPSAVPRVGLLASRPRNVQRQPPLNRHIRFGSDGEPLPSLSVGPSPQTMTKDSTSDLPASTFEQFKAALRVEMNTKLANARNELGTLMDSYKSKQAVDNEALRADLKSMIGAAFADIESRLPPPPLSEEEEQYVATIRPFFKGCRNGLFDKDTALGLCASKLTAQFPEHIGLELSAKRVWQHLERAHPPAPVVALPVATSDSDEPSSSSDDDERMEVSAPAPVAITLTATAPAVDRHVKVPMPKVFAGKLTTDITRVDTWFDSVLRYLDRFKLNPIEYFWDFLTGKAAEWGLWLLQEHQSGAQVLTRDSLRAAFLQQYDDTRRRKGLVSREKFMADEHAWQSGDTQGWLRTRISYAFSVSV